MACPLECPGRAIKGAAYRARHGAALAGVVR